MISGELYSMLSMLGYSLGSELPSHKQISSDFTHLLGEAHDLQPVALPDWSVGAGVHQLIHLFHSLNCGDLG